MLEFFNAALAGLAQPRPYDGLADMAAILLDGAGVAFVEGVAPGEAGEGASLPTVTGANRAMVERARGVVQAGDVLAAAAAVTVTDVATLTDLAALSAHGARLAGTRLPCPPPCARVIRLPVSKPAPGRPVECLVFPLLPGVEPARLLQVIDAAGRRLAETTLMQRYRTDLKRYITMYDHIERTGKIGLWDYDLISRSLSWSDEVFRIFECPNEEAPTMERALQGFPSPGRERLRDELQEVQLTGAACDLTLPFVTTAGRKRVIRVIASLHRSGAGEERVLGVFQDVTAQQAATERLWWAANHDALTHLPNRALFADRFHKALERRKRTGTVVGLVLVDIDDFKQVNDTLGHAAGDRLLKEVARRLTETVRAHDTVARTGGDEFSVLLENLADEEALTDVLARLRQALQVRLNWAERTVLVTLSAGAAIAPDHGLTEHELTCAADLALYEMKDVQRDALALYEPRFGRAVQERNALLAAVREALEDGRIVPYYQPQVDIAAGRVVAVEALARWVTEDGVRPAADFAPALRDDELGARIGATIADQAIADIAQLNRGRCRKIALSLNASAGELVRDCLLERIGRLYSSGETTGAPITVELNEDVVIDDPDGDLSRRLQEASAAGVRFSLDDFGSAGTSLVTVSMLPISEVKIDRRFVVGLEDDRTRQRVLRGLIEMARTLGLRLIVEGVETAEQMRRISELGGRFAQGFFYSPALPPKALAELLAKEDERAASAPVGCGGSRPTGALGAVA